MLFIYFFQKIIIILPLLSAFVLYIDKEPIRTRHAEKNQKNAFAE